MTLHPPHRPQYRPHAHERSSQEDHRRALLSKAESAVLVQLVSPIPLPGLQVWYSQSDACQVYRIVKQAANEKPRSAVCSELALCHYCCQPLIHDCCQYVCLNVAVSRINSGSPTAGSSKSSRHQTTRALLGSISPARVATQAMDVQHPDQCTRTATGAEPGFESFQ